MIALAFALALAQGPDLGPCAAIDRPNPTRAQARTIITCANGLVARQMSRNLPTRVDELTTLIGVIASGTRIVYSMRVDLPREQMSGPEISRREQLVRNTVCGTRSMRSTISYGGSYQYIWLDRQGHRMHSFSIVTCPPSTRR